MNFRLSFYAAFKVYILVNKSSFEFEFLHFKDKPSLLYNQNMLQALLVFLSLSLSLSLSDIFIFVINFRAPVDLRNKL